MSENKEQLTHVLVPIEWIEQEKAEFKELYEASSLAQRQSFSGARVAYDSILREHPHINLAAQQSYIKQLEDALNKITEMKLENGETDYKYAFNRCWHIATEVLQSKLK